MLCGSKKLTPYQNTFILRETHQKQQKINRTFGDGRTEIVPTVGRPEIFRTVGRAENLGRRTDGKISLGLSMKETQ